MEKFWRLFIITWWISCLPEKNATKILFTLSLQSSALKKKKVVIGPYLEQFMRFSMCWVMLSRIKAFYLTVSTTLCFCFVFNKYVQYIFYFLPKYSIFCCFCERSFYFILIFQKIFAGAVTPWTGASVTGANPLYIWKFVCNFWFPQNFSANSLLLPYQ